MNLYYGVFSQFVRLIYSIGMIVNLMLQLIPVIEVIETYQPKIYGTETLQILEGQHIA